MQIKSVMEASSCSPPEYTYWIDELPNSTPYLFDKVTWQLDIYSAVGERSGMHNTCENRQRRDDPTGATTSETFKSEHTLSAEEIR